MVQYAVNIGFVMKPSPEHALDPDKRSGETFFQWFSRISDQDLRSGDRDALRSYFARRGGKWFEYLWNEWHDFHEAHAGFKIPELRGERGLPAEPGRSTPRRPLIWNLLGTAGSGHGQGGLDARFAFFGPLFYPGIVFTDAVAVPSEICKNMSWNELQGRPSRDNFLKFVDLLIDYAPLFDTGQMAVMSERTAFGVARPPSPHPNPWKSEFIEQDIRKREINGSLSKEESQAAPFIPWIHGNLALAEAHDLDPMFVEDDLHKIALAFDYLAEAAFAGTPRNVFADLVPPPKFLFQFNPELEPRTKREAAEMMAGLIDDEYWGRVREIIGEAAGESTRGNYIQHIQDGMRELATRRSKPPPAYLSLVEDFTQNYVGSAATWLSISAASYVGLDWLEPYLDSNKGANLLYSAGTATGAILTADKLVARVRRRRHIGPDILSYASRAVGDPSREQLIRRAAAEKMMRSLRQPQKN